MNNRHVHGVDILGWSEAPIKIDGSIIPLAQAGGQQPALVVRVKNAANVVAQQGGATGKLAFDLVPNTITNLVYGKMRDEFSSKLKEQGVDADVTVTTTPPNGPSPRSDFIPGIVVGAALTGIGLGALRLFRR